MLLEDFYKPFLLNPYERKDYIIKGSVDTILYKEWNYNCYKQGVQVRKQPAAQYLWKYNEYGKIFKTEVQRYPTMLFTDPKLYSGGTDLFYDEQNRLIKYKTDEWYRNNNYSFIEQEFFYDEYNNIHLKSEFVTSSYDDKGRLIETIWYDEQKLIEKRRKKISYDDLDRITNMLDYGYYFYSDEDDGDNDYVDFEKGIVLTYSFDYCYSYDKLTEEILCECLTYDTQYNEYHIKHLIFDKYNNLKTYIEFDKKNKATTTWNYDLTYDKYGNWISKIIDIERPIINERNTIQKFERIITYL